jgi:hypothetical protein
MIPPQASARRGKEMCMLSVVILAASLVLPGASGAKASPDPSPPTLLLAQYDASGGGYSGTGSDFGKGWSRSKKKRVYSGTGGNFGGGFESGGGGRRWTGTGKRFGGSYEVQAGGKRIVGTGNNFGKGWERSGSEWVGTGGNFGKRCPARPGSSFVPCM